MEELHFRGLLLRPYENLLGKAGANFCIALFFTLVHVPITYTANIGQFLVILFILALAWSFGLGLYHPEDRKSLGSCPFSCRSRPAGHNQHFTEF